MDSEIMIENAEDNIIRNCFYKRVRTPAPKDQIDMLSYCAHPDGHVNPYETPTKLTEYQLKYCTFKLKTDKQLDTSQSEQSRVIDLMEKLWTIQQRSYTNPHDSHYSVVRSKAIEPLLDRIKEAEMKHIKMNIWSEYQAKYDRQEYMEIV